MKALINGQVGSEKVENTAVEIGCMNYFCDGDVFCPLRKVLEELGKSGITDFYGAKKDLNFVNATENRNLITLDVPDISIKEHENLQIAKNQFVSFLVPGKIRKTADSVCSLCKIISAFNENGNER